jgi:Na+/proline symporter
VANLYREVVNLGTYEVAYQRGAFPDGKYTVAWIIAIFSMQFVAQLQLGWSARFFVAKDGNEARKAAALMLAIMLLGLIFFTTPSFISRVLYPEQVASYAGVLNKAEESAYVVACLNLLPNGLLGMVLVAMFSATASSMDTGLNGNAATIVRNIMPPLRRRFKMTPLDPQTEMVWGKRISAVLAVVIVSITLFLASFGRSGIFELIVGFAAAVNFPMTLPFFLALFARNAPRACAVYSIVFGLGGQWVAKPILAAMDISLDYPERVLMVAIFSVSGFMLSYVFAKRETPEQKAETDRFYEKMHKPVNFREEVGDDNDKEQLKTIGGMSIIIGLLMTSLLIVPNDWQSRLTILAMGGSVLLLGSLLVWLSLRVLKKDKA